MAAQDAAAVATPTVADEADNEDGVITSTNTNGVKTYSYAGHSGGGSSARNGGLAVTLGGREKQVRSTGAHLSDAAAWFLTLQTQKLELELQARRDAQEEARASSGMEKMQSQMASLCANVDAMAASIRALVSVFSASATAASQLPLSVTAAPAAPAAAPAVGAPAAVVGVPAPQVAVPASAPPAASSPHAGTKKKKAPREEAAPATESDSTSAPPAKKEALV